jgi:hypothetical protein
LVLAVVPGARVGECAEEVVEEVKLVFYTTIVSP